MSGRFVSPFPPPEGRPRELLTILAEECAEVTQRATKALRFGLAEIQPGQPHDNAWRLGQEIGDLMCVINAVLEEGLIPAEAVEAGVVAKLIQLEKFMQAGREPPG